VAIAVAPASAAVTAGGTLAFHATLLDGDGNELPGSAYTITWLPSAAWVEVTWQADGDAMILANGGFGPGTVTVELRAEAGGAASPAVLIQITETTAPAATGDRLVATAPTGVQEHAALVSGLVAGACRNHAGDSFPAVLALPSHTARCADDGFGEVAFFSPEARMEVRDVGWTATDDVVDFTAAAAPIVIPVAAWVAVTEDVDAVKGMIDDDLTLASGIMKEARAGVSFTLLGDTVGVVPANHIAEVGPGCYDVQIADVLSQRPQEYVPGVLNLYYLE